MVPRGLLLGCGQGGWRGQSDGLTGNGGNGRQGGGRWANNRSQIRDSYFLGKGKSPGGAVRTESPGKPQLENPVLGSCSRTSAMHGCCHVIRTEPSRASRAWSGLRPSQGRPSQAGPGPGPGEAGRAGGGRGARPRPPGTLSPAAPAAAPGGRGHGGAAAAPAAAGERGAAGAGVRPAGAVPAAGRRQQAGPAAGRQPGGGAVSAPGARLGAGAGGMASPERSPGFPGPSSNSMGEQSQRAAASRGGIQVQAIAAGFECPADRCCVLSDPQEESSVT